MSGQNLEGKTVFYLISVIFLWVFLLSSPSNDAIAQNTSQSSILRMQHTVDTIKKGMDGATRKTGDRQKVENCTETQAVEDSSPEQPCLANPLKTPPAGAKSPQNQ